MHDNLHWHCFPQLRSRVLVNRQENLSLWKMNTMGVHTPLIYRAQGLFLQMGVLTPTTYGMHSLFFLTMSMPTTMTYGAQGCSWLCEPGRAHIATYGMHRLFFMTMGAFTPTMNRVGLLPFWLWLHSHPWCTAPKARTLWVRVCSHPWRTETLLFIYFSMSASTQFSIGGLMAQPIK